jgi:hypothetical protein
MYFQRHSRVTNERDDQIEETLFTELQATSLLTRFGENRTRDLRCKQRCSIHVVPSAFVTLKRERRPVSRETIDRRIY